jgi:hypothetical protein
MTLPLCKPPFCKCQSLPHKLNDHGAEEYFSAILRTLFKELTSQLINEFIPGKSGSPA